MTQENKPSIAFPDIENDEGEQQRSFYMKFLVTIVTDGQMESGMLCCWRGPAGGTLQY